MNQTVYEIEDFTIFYFIIVLHNFFYIVMYITVLQFFLSVHVSPGNEISIIINTSALIFPDYALFNCEPFGRVLITL